MKNAKWSFARQTGESELSTIPSISGLYQRAMNNRDCKREMYERALNAALENLFSWERAARADGFVIETATDTYNGTPHPVFSPDGLHVTFVQAYGVMVKDEKDQQKEKKLTPADLAETCDRDKMTRAIGHV